MYGMHSLQNAVFESAQIQRPRVDYSNKVVSYDYFIFDLFLLLFCMYNYVHNVCLVHLLRRNSPF